MRFATFLLVGWAAYAAIAAIQAFYPHGIEAMSGSLVLVNLVSVSLSFAFACLLPFSLLYFAGRDSAWSLAGEMFLLAIASMLILYVLVRLGGMGTLVRGTTTYIEHGSPTLDYHLSNLVRILPAYLAAWLGVRWIWGDR